MKVNSINSLSFAGRIKKNEIAKQTNKETKLQKENSNLKVIENAISTGTATVATVIPTVFIIMPISDKSV